MCSVVLRFDGIGKDFLRRYARTNNVAISVRNRGEEEKTRRRRKEEERRRTKSGEMEEEVRKSKEREIAVTPGGLGTSLLK